MTECPDIIEITEMLIIELDDTVTNNQQIPLDSNATVPIPPKIFWMGRPEEDLDIDRDIDVDDEELEGRLQVAFQMDADWMRELRGELRREIKAELEKKTLSSASEAVHKPISAAETVGADEPMLSVMLVSEAVQVPISAADEPIASCFKPGMSPASSKTPANKKRSKIRQMKNHKKIKCPNCRKIFNSGSKLNNHNRTHTGEKPFICPEKSCLKAFNDMSNLSSHRRTTGHHNWKVVCPTCTKPFPTKLSLQKHTIEACRKYLAKIRKADEFDEKYKFLSDYVIKK